MPQILSLLVVAAFPALVITAALKDLTSFTIPNWLTIALALAFAPAALATGLSLGHVGLHLAVGAACLMAGMAMFAAGWIGGGDAKLLAAAALWVGWPAVMPFVMYTALAGGVLALTLVSARRSQLEIMAVRGPGWVSRLLEKTGPAPYGVAIAVGGLAAFPQCDLIQFLGLGI